MLLPVNICGAIKGTTPRALLTFRTWLLQLVSIGVLLLFIYSHFSYARRGIRLMQLRDESLEDRAIDI